MMVGAFLPWLHSVKLHDMNVLIFIQSKQVWTVFFSFTVSWICISLMLQEQEVTLVWDLCLQNKGGKTGFEKCRRRTLTHFWVESRSNAQGIRVGNENDNGLGEGRRKSQRGAEGMRGDGDKMQHLYVYLWRCQCTYFTGVSPGFFARTTKQPAFQSWHTHHMFQNISTTWKCKLLGSYRGMQGWVCGTEQKGSCITTSPTSVKSQDSAGTSAVEMQQCAGLGSSAVSSNFAPFGLTDNIGNMKLYYQWHCKIRWQIIPIY